MFASGLSIAQYALLIYIVGEIHTSQELRRGLIMNPPMPVAVTRIPEFPDEPRPQVAN
jgi:hypothetical protein